MTRTVKERVSSPWFSPIIKKAKQDKRQAERKWLKTGLHVHKQIYVFFKNKCNLLCQRAKELYFQTKFSSVKTCKELYQVTTQLFDQKESKVFPSNVSKAALPALFSDFFHSKVSRIRESLEQHSFDFDEPVTFEGEELNCFRNVTQDEVKKIILSSPSKSCELDPLPTELLKQCITELLPFITDFINSSLSSGIVPKCFKNAIINPLLKS